MIKIEIIRGDITLQQVDAIVNAANRSLLGGGGVDGAIHRAAGSELLKSCELLNGCNTGAAKITSGFLLPARYVIHTVGPVWQDGKHGEKELLSSCYQQSLKLAIENNITTIAFPNISTGVYGFPKNEAAIIALETVQQFLRKNPEMERVVFCCFDKENFTIYNKLLKSNIMIEKVISKKDIQIVARLAGEIWNEHYVPIIGQQQVDYMVSTFQSEDAVENQIKNENYEYFILFHLSEPSGYFAVKQTGEDLFLSKLYSKRKEEPDWERRDLGSFPKRQKNLAYKG